MYVFELHAMKYSISSLKQNIQVVVSGGGETKHKTWILMQVNVLINSADSQFFTFISGFILLIHCSSHLWIVFSQK